MSGTIRIHAFVSGVVQGVYFRDSTRRRAQELGIFGWVKNLSDGRVEVVMEGKEEVVRQLLEYVHAGPPLARVEKVDVVEEEYRGEFKEFSLQR